MSFETVFGNIISILSLIVTVSIIILSVGHDTKDDLKLSPEIVSDILYRVMFVNVWLVTKGVVQLFSIANHREQRCQLV